jgi:hypothetical protein
MHESIAAEGRKECDYLLGNNRLEIELIEPVHKPSLRDIGISGFADKSKMSSQLAHMRTR